MSRLANTIEAVLYLKAQPLKIAQIAEFAKCDKDTAEEGLIELMGEYAHREGALEIAETEEGYALQLREVYKPLVDSIVPLDIGLGALRTLAAIALRGPIAQSELVDLRGSGVYQHVPDLVEQGFVKKRRQSDGRSSWLQITEKFYQHFEIDKLPQIANLSLPKPIKGKEQALTDSALTDKAISEAPDPDISEENSGLSEMAGSEREPAIEPAGTAENTDTAEAISATEPEVAEPEVAEPEVADEPIDSTVLPRSVPDAAPGQTAEETTTDRMQLSEDDADAITPEMAEEIAILSGQKAPTRSNAPLSDEALEAAIPLETALPLDPKAQAAIENTESKEPT